MPYRAMYRVTMVVCNKFFVDIVTLYYVVEFEKP